MALTVQSVAIDVSIDVRQVVGVTGSDLTILTGFIDRIHKDVLHSSIYSYLNIASTSFSTSIGVPSYTLTPTNIRRILGMWDSTRSRILFPIERATTPVSQVEKQEPNPGQQGSPGIEFGQPLVSPVSLQVGQPGYFRHLGATTVNLYPIPQQVLNIGVSYEKQVSTLVNPSDILQVPDDARDIVVAGVDWLANMYIKRAEEAQVWLQIYQALKRGESLV